MSTTEFRGTSTHSLDDKSRLIVPKRFQESVSGESDSNFVLTASPDGCLLLLDTGAFDRIRGRFGDDPLDQNRPARQLRRLILGHAEDVKPDKAGRIVIPEALRLYMGLGASASREIVVVGTGVSIELWSTERWDSERKSVLETELTSSLSGDQ
jgi:MraZ protein